jgi:Flp pilus assembly protein TadD
VDPHRLPLRVEYADFLWQTRRFDRGNAEMDRVLRQVPGNTRLRVHYGLKLADQSRFADAVRQFEGARSAGDRSAETLVYLGSSLWEVGRLEDAARRLREAAALDPKSSSAPHRLGRLLIFLGSTAEAVRELEKAARLSPESAPVQLDLGRAYEASGRVADAEAAYRRALALEPDLSATNYALGTLLARTGRREEALPLIAIYQKAFQKVQEQRYQAASRRAEINLGLTFLDAGRLEDALAQFARMPDDPEAMRGRAAALSRLGRHAEAVTVLERASLLDPDDPAVRWQLDREREKMPPP